MSLIEKISEKLKISEDILEKELEIIKERFKGQSEEVIREKALLILKAKYKKRILSSALEFKGIIIATEKPRDMWRNHRKERLGKFIEAINKGTEAIDELITQEIIATVRPPTEIYTEFVKKEDDKKEDYIIDLFKNEIVYPLNPKKNSNGEKSKVAGKKMTSEENAMIQNVYGFCYEANKSKENEQEIVPFVMSISGKACKEIFPKTAIKFDAVRKKAEGKLLSLKSYDLRLKKIEDKKIKEISNEMVELIKNTFSENLVTFEDIKKWTEEEKVPKEISNKNFVIIDTVQIIDAVLMDEQLKGNAGSASIEDLGETDFYYLAGKIKQNFVEGSKVLMIGRPWMPKPEEGDKARLILFASGIFPYKGFFKTDLISKNAENLNLNAEKTNSKKENEKKEEAW